MRPMRATSALVLAATSASALGQFNYQLYGMPDFDQKRAVPCDGAGHCAPTAAIDLMAYISNHGFPAIMDGPRNWQLEQHAADVTFQINLMGLYMDTDPQCAGTGSDWGAGLIDYMNQEAGGLFTVTEWHATAEDNYVTPFWMYVKLFSGGLVDFCYGRYAQLPDQTWERQPGHVVTLTGLVNADTDNVTFKFR